MPDVTAAELADAASASRSQSPAKRLKADGDADAPPDPAVLDTPDAQKQVEMVRAWVKDAPLVEGDEWFVVSLRWLRRFYAQHPDSKVVLPKEDAGKPPGPIDNSDIIAETPADGADAKAFVALDPADASTTDEFVPLKPGDLEVDFELLPRDAWEALVRWYGVSPASQVVRRKVANTAEPGAEDNLQVEIFPPMFTVYRLRDPAAIITADSLNREKKSTPRQVVAPRGTGFQKFLKKVKDLAEVEQGRKVRLWRVLRTPEDSGKGKKEKVGTFAQMVLDVQTFLKLQNQVDRELLELPDETNNPNYNGRSKLGTVGLGQGGAIVLEEQGSSGWASEVVSKVTTKFGYEVSIEKKGTMSAKTAKKEKPAAPIRSSSPGKSLLQRGTDFITRNREKREGRTLGTCGLSNLGNTCYMNSALQCLRSVEELSKYFISGEYEHELNPTNLIGHQGKVAKAYAGLLKSIFASSSPSSVAPREFKNTIGRFNTSFSGYGQQDTQEFLAFLLDGLHEDLNRITKKPYTEKPDSTDEMVGDNEAIAKLAETHWDIYKKRNDSAVADLFAGLYKSTLVCPECQKVSITFDPFMDLTLPLPIESLWSKDVIFMPSRKSSKFQSPVKIPVELQKHASMRTLKEFIAKRVDCDPKRIMGAETYSHKFYKLYEDNKSVGEQIQRDDVAVFYELETEFTNYPPKQRNVTRSTYRFSNSYDDEDEDNIPETNKLLVPVFTKTGRVASDSTIPDPFFIVLDRQEQRDYNVIMEKIIEKYAVLTTSDLYEGGEPLSDEDESLEQVKSPEAAKEKSDDEKDGFVDVQKQDAMSMADSDEPGTPPAPSRRRKVPENLLEALHVKVCRAKHTDGPIQTGWTSLTEDEDLIARARPSRPLPAVTEKPTSLLNPDVPPPLVASPVSDASDNGHEMEIDLHASSDEEDGVSTRLVPPSHGFYNQSAASKSSVNLPAAISRSASPLPPSPTPIVKYGEALVVHWSTAAHEACFTGTAANSLHGRPTWQSPPVLPDPALAAARRRREERRRQGIHLEDCLDEFVKEEVLSETDPWYCPRCKEHRRASKKFELWKAPDILVIHLKRFSSSRSFRDKLDVMINAPTEGLDLSHRVGGHDGNTDLIYDLIAVDNHYGGLGGGHYTAYVKNWVDGNWYYCDDASVRSAEASSVVTPAAYLLFYRRRSNKPLGGPAYEKLLGDVDARVNNLEAEELADHGDESMEADTSDDDEGAFVGPLAPVHDPDVGNDTLWGHSLPVVRVGEDEEEARVEVVVPEVGGEDEAVEVMVGQDGQDEEDGEEAATGGLSGVRPV